MKKIKLVSSLLTGALLCTTLAACGSAASGTGTSETTTAVTAAVADPTSASVSSETKSITVTDDDGRQVEINIPVKKALLLDTGPYVVLSAFDKLDLLVGNHSAILTNPMFESIKNLPEVATHSEINFEMIGELLPEVIISSTGNHGTITDNENIDGFDIKDVKLNLRNPDLMKQGIETLGKVFESEEKADEIIAFYDKWQKVIDDKISSLSDSDKKKVYVEYHGGAFKTGAPGSRFYKQIELAGGINIAKDLAVGDEPEVSAEWVAEQNPDVIIREASGMGFSAENTDKAKEIYDDIMTREGISGISAIQNKNIHLLSVDIYSRPGYIVGVCQIAKWLYPDLFADLNPDDVLKEYFDIFFPGQGVRGIWTYDE